MAPVIAARVGYVGELGWEIYIPVDYAAYVFDTLVAAGADPDLPDKASAMTPLHYAASGGHMDALNALLGESARCVCQGLSQQNQ